MLSTNFHHELLRKYVILFGNLFNNVKIKRSDGTTDTQFFKVPISYAPMEKALAMVSIKPTVEKKQAIVLPRMSFEITGLEYDATRKFGRTLMYRVGNNVLFEPSPWNINFDLNIITKTDFDGTKIVEQILPYFNKEWNLTVQLLDDVERTWDIPVVLNNVQHTDSYENDFITRRALIWTLSFTLKGWFHGPTHERKVIKFIKVNTYTDTLATTPSEYVTIQPGQTANGEPTTDINETVPYADIEADEPWDYIIQFVEESP